jgi:hypothetical protein
MKKLILLFIVSMAAYAGDPQGWGKARWGMTEAQVARAFGGTAPAETSIGAFKYKVLYNHDKSGKLQSVILSPVDTDGSMSVYYEDIVAKLKSKYGKPETEAQDKKRITSQRGEAIWSMSKTKIKVKYVINHFGDSHVKFMMIDYRSASMPDPSTENL